MNKDLPQPSPERLAELISKHLIPAAQKQPKKQKNELPRTLNLTKQLKANHHHISGIIDRVERAKKAKQNEEEQP